MPAVARPSVAATPPVAAAPPVPVAADALPVAAAPAAADVGWALARRPAAGGMVHRAAHPAALPAAIFAIGLASALLWTFVVFPRLSVVQQVFDLNQFGVIAENLYLGHGFSLRGWELGSDGPTLRRAPLYPYLLAGVFAVFGFDPADRAASYTPVFVLHCLFAATSCLLAFATARRLFPLPAAVLAGLLTAVWPQCLRYLGAVDVEALMTLLVTLVTYATVRLYQQPSLANGLVLGAALGAATLAKPVPQLFIAVLPVLMLWRWRRRRARAVPAPLAFAALPLAACAAVFLALLAPWVVRNHLVTGGRFHGLSSNAPGEFVRGFVAARPDYALLRTTFQGSWDWDANLYEDSLLRRHGASLLEESGGSLRKVRATLDGEIAKDRLQAAIARELVLADPLGFARKFLVQLGTFWYLVETPGKSLLVGGLAALALGLATLGGVQARARGIDIAPVVAVLLYFQVTYAAILALARYSMPLFPSLLVLSAYGLWRLAERPIRRSISWPRAPSAPPSPLLVQPLGPVARAAGDDSPGGAL
jgi:hypothetical protein